MQAKLYKVSKYEEKAIFTFSCFFFQHSIIKHQNLIQSMKVYACRYGSTSLTIAFLFYIFVFGFV